MPIINVKTLKIEQEKRDDGIIKTQRNKMVVINLKKLEKCAWKKE